MQDSSVTGILDLAPSFWSYSAVEFFQPIPEYEEFFLTLFRYLTSPPRIRNGVLCRAQYCLDKTPKIFA